MNRNDRLYNDYEDALFALMMDKVAQEEGARLLEENERLKNDPAAAVPPELDKKSLETIRRTLAGQHRRHTHTVGWYLSRLAVAILAALLLFAVAYASIPDLRLKTLQMLIENSDVSSRLSFAVGGNDQNCGTEERPRTLAGYTLPEISDSYIVADQGETSREAWIAYQHTDGSMMRIKITESSDFFIDSEEVDKCEDIDIHGYLGKMYEKNGAIYLSFYDTDREKIITLYADGIDKEAARTYAEQMSYVG